MLNCEPIYCTQINCKTNISGFSFGTSRGGQGQGDEGLKSVTSFSTNFETKFDTKFRSCCEYFLSRMRCDLTSEVRSILRYS